MTVLIAAACIIPQAGSYAAASVRGYTCQVEIDASRVAGNDQIAIEFYPGVRIESTPAITNAEGNAVHSETFPRVHQDGTKLLMVFNGSDGSKTYTLHYGGRGGATPPSGRWSALPSLLIETRAKPRGIGNDWRGMQKMLQESEGTTQGVMFVPNIWHAMNPFGPSDEFITIYRGHLDIKENTRLRLFTASSDASFVFIDGELAFSWPGEHAVYDGREGKYGKDMTLAKGRHAIEYYHVQSAGQTFMTLGMIQHGKKERETVPASMFVHTPKATVGKPVRKDGKPAAHFKWRQGELLLFDQDEYSRYGFETNVSGEVDSVLWDFGDGVTSSEPKTQHVFFNKPPFRVRLTITSGNHTDTCLIIVPFETPMANITIEDVQLLEEFIDVISTYPFDTMPGSVLGKFFELFDVLERPLVTGTLAEVINRRFPRSPLGLRVKHVLAQYYAITAPKDAIPFLRDLSESSNPDIANEARVDLMELHLHRFRDFEEVERLASSHISTSSDKSPLHRIALCKQGDVLLMQGDKDKAEAKYLEAQKLAFERMPLREIDLRQGAYAETVTAHIIAGQLRAARKQLLQWEADFPISKVRGEFILVSSRYWEAMGDPHKALDNMKALIEINPLTPHLPQIELRMAHAYRRLGERDKAIELYTKIMKEYPLNPVSFEAQLTLRTMKER